MTIIFNHELGTFKDSRDSKVYKTVKIGSQIWMAENLAYNTGSGCWAYNDDIVNVAQYGYLYDWATARVSSPPGWHLPTINEWEILIKFLGGDYQAGGKMKETGTGHWPSPNTATNESGFTALPSGNRLGYAARFYNIGGAAWYWSANEIDFNHAATYTICDLGSHIKKDTNSTKGEGISVRCIQSL